MIEIETDKGDLFEFEDGTTDADISDTIDTFYAEPARLAADTYKSFGSQVEDVVLESAAAFNRGVAGTFNIPSMLFNSVSELAGSDVRVANVTDLPVIREGTQGNFMEDSTARDAIRVGGEFFGGSAIGTAALMGLASRAQAISPLTHSFNKANIAVGPGAKSVPLSQIESAAVNPVRVLNRELQAGALFSGGASGASVISEGDPVAEIAGGLLAATRGKPIRTVGQIARGTGQGLKQAFSKKAARNRAVKFLHDHATNKDAAIRELKKNLALKKKGTLAQLTGDEGIAAIENRLINSAPTDIGVRIRITDESVLDDIVQAYDDVARVGEPGAASDFFRARVNSSLSKINSSVQRATDDAASALERAGTPLETQGASVALSQAADDAFARTRVIEDEAWLGVTDGLSQKTRSMKESIRDSLAKLSPTARRAVLPKISRETNLIKQLADEVHPRELSDLRGEILSGKRAAREANASANVLKALDDMQSAVLEAIDSTSTATSYRNATAITAKKHELFFDGLFGKVRGARDTVTENIGEKLLRTDGIGGSLADEIAKIDASVGGTAVSDASEEMVRASFGRSVGDNGVLNESLAKRFLDRHNTLLSRFPKLKEELADATTAQGLVDRVTKAGLNRARAVEKSRASLFSDFDDPAGAVRSVINTRNPTEAVNSLVRSANRDETGKALVGLKRNFIEDITKRLLTPTAKGLQINTGYRKEWAKLRKPLAESNLFGPDEITRLDSLVKEMDTLLIRRRVPAIKENLQDEFLVIALGQITGARVGAKFGVTPLIAAGLGRKLAKKVLQNMPRDRTMGFVEDMVLNPSNFDEFMKQVDIAKTEEQLLSALNGWALAAGVRPVIDQELSGVLASEVDLTAGSLFDTKLQSNSSSNP